MVNKDVPSHDGELTVAEHENQGSTLNLGARLKELRLRKGFSQRQLATEAGVTSGFISQVERNKVNPSISTLRRMINALGMGMAEFYTSNVPNSSQIFFRKEEMVNMGSGDIAYMLVGAPRRSRKMNLVRETYAPYADTGPLKHTGHEAGFIISGHIELTVDNEVALLGPGDGYYFESWLPHRFHNPHDTPCDIVSVNTPPSF